MKCLKCGGKTEEGYTIYPALPYFMPAYWVKELATKTGLLKTNIPYGDIRSGVSVRSLKCKSCGYLESYAK